MLIYWMLHSITISTMYPSRSLSYSSWSWVIRIHPFKTQFDQIWSFLWSTVSPTRWKTLLPCYSMNNRIHSSSTLFYSEQQLQSFQSSLTMIEKQVQNEIEFIQQSRRKLFNQPILLNIKDSIISFDKQYDIVSILHSFLSNRYC